MISTIGFISFAQAESANPTAIQDRGLDTASYLAEWDKPVIVAEGIRVGDAAKPPETTAGTQR